MKAINPAARRNFSLRLPLISAGVAPGPEWVWPAAAPLPDQVTPNVRRAHLKIPDSSRDKCSRQHRPTAQLIKTEGRVRGKKGARKKDSVYSN